MTETNNRSFSHAVKITALTLIGILALSGCAAAQVKGLVMGGADTLMPTHLSMATVDVVLDKGYNLQQKPVCKATDEDATRFTCNGVTVDGLKILTTAHETAHSEADMKVEVDGKQVFEGTMAEVFTRQYEGAK